MKVVSQIIEIINKKKNIKSTVLITIDEFKRLTVNLLDGEFPLFTDVIKTLMNDKNFNSIYKKICWWEKEGINQNKYKIRRQLKTDKVKYGISIIYPSVQLFDKYDLFDLSNGCLITDIHDVEIDIFLKVVKTEFDIDLTLPRKKYKNGLKIKHLKSLDELNFEEIKLI